MGRRSLSAGRTKLEHWNIIEYWDPCRGKMVAGRESKNIQIKTTSKGSQLNPWNDTYAYICIINIYTFRDVHISSYHIYISIIYRPELDQSIFELQFSLVPRWQFGFCSVFVNRRFGKSATTSPWRTGRSKVEQWCFVDGVGSKMGYQWTHNGKHQ